MTFKARIRFIRIALLLLVLSLLSLFPNLTLADGPVSKPKMRTENQPLHGHNGTLKTILVNNDESDIDPAPNLSALCQSYIGGTNPFKNPSPNVDMIVGDTIVSAGSQTGCSAAQNETSIVVNPSNPKNLVGGTNDYRLFNTRESRNDGSGWAYTTFDGGASWANVLLPHLTYQSGATGLLSDMDSAGDPALAFGPKNTVYYANIAFSRLNSGSAITINVSHNGGLTWDNPVVIQADGVDSAGNPLPTDYFNDKEWVTADPNSGTVYVSWTRFSLYDSPIVVSRSTDFGATWSPFVVVNPGLSASGLTPYSQGSYPQVGREDGELYIAYESAVCQTLLCDQPTDHDAIIMAKSTNGGRSFTNTEVAINYDFPYNPDTGRSTLTGENFRINSFPSFALDRKSGQFYLTWADDRNGKYDAFGNSIKTNGDVLVATSKDGEKWNLRDLGSNADEVYPAVAAFDGHAVVSFYTRKYDPNGIGLDYAYINISKLEGSSNYPIKRITTQTENPQVQFVGIGAVSGKVLQGVFIGDYTAIALGSDLNFHPCWTDFRGNPGKTLPNQDAYTQSISLNDN